MVPKLVVALLVVAMSGANSGLASLCAAYCMSSASAASAAAHPYQMESRQNPAGVGHHIHAHHQGTECPECPSKPGKSFNQKADCASSDQMETLKQDSFNLVAPHGLTLFDAADTHVRAVGLTWDGKRSFVFDASRPMISLPSTSLPLRI